MSLEDAIKGIMHYREQIHQGHLWGDPVSLSEAMTKLAIYNAYLADNLSPLHQGATDTSYQIFREAKDKGESTTSAEQMSRGESTKEREAYEKCKHVYTSTSNLISVIQTRIRVLENQMKQEKI